MIRVIKLYGLDKAREEEELSVHTVYDTILELMHTGCSKNSNKKKYVDDYMVTVAQFFVSSVELELKKMCSTEIGLPSTASGSLIKVSYTVS